MALAGVAVGQFGAVHRWFNRFGGAPQVDRVTDDVGRSRTGITFPGIDLALQNVHHQTTVVGLPGVATPTAPQGGSGQPEGDIVIQTVGVDGDPHKLAFEYLIYGTAP